MRLMHRSTVFFAALSFVLLLGMSAVSWKLFTYQPERNIPLAGGASVDLGLPTEEKKASDSNQFTAGSALLYNTSTNQIMYEQNAFERKPIASISKLMTAMVALDHNMPLDKLATIQPEEYVQGGQLMVQPGEEVTMKDLLAASLVGSANNATLAYVRELSIPKEEFIQEMNRKAIELGLEQTQFEDVTGLDTDNVSTAYEVALMAHHAFSHYPLISELTSMKEYPITFIGSGREHSIRNTNKLITEWGINLSGSKTGYLYEARYCLVSQGTGEQADRIAVVLDSPSDVEHFSDMKSLLYMLSP